MKELVAGQERFTNDALRAEVLALVIPVTPGTRVASLACENQPVQLKPYHCPRCGVLLVKAAQGSVVEAYCRRCKTRQTVCIK